MARLALRPQVAAAVDVAPEYRMEEIEVMAGCAGEGKAISDVRGATVIAALRRGSGPVDPQPPENTVLGVGDVLVAMGTGEALARLEELFVPPRKRAKGPEASREA
jgi:voltage-gated potassium channel